MLSSRFRYRVIDRLKSARERLPSTNRSMVRKRRGIVDVGVCISRRPRCVRIKTSSSLSTAALPPSASFLTVFDIEFSTTSLCAQRTPSDVMDFTTHYTALATLSRDYQPKDYQPKYPTYDKHREINQCRVVLACGKDGCAQDQCVQPLESYCHARE
jgi:hypothetical protein